MFTIMILSLSMANASPDGTAKSNTKDAQSIKTYCMAEEQKTKQAHSPQTICDCVLTNLQANASAEELKLIVKKQKGRSVIKDIRKIEGAQTLFPFYEDIIEACRENPNYVYVEEEPPPELRATQSLPAEKKTSVKKRKH